MSELLLEIEYRDYSITAYHDIEAPNPIKDSDCQPVIVLSPGHEREYGWTSDDEWGKRLTTAFNRLLESRVTRTLRGTTGALAILDRWLRIFYSTRSMPISILDHSGVLVYLGAEAHMQDPGGWDSGWAGWILYNPEMADYPEITADQMDATMRAALEEFTCWVSGDTFGYTVTDPDGKEVDQCWCFYGLDNLSDDDGWVRHQVQQTIDLDITARTPSS